MEIINTLSNLAIHLIESWGYLGIFILMTLEGMNFIIPSEVVIPFSGYLASRGSFDLLLVALVASLGNLFGCLIIYALSYFYRERIFKFFSKIFFINKHHFETAEKWFQKFGISSVFFIRLLPAVRNLISFPAGIFRMNFILFSSLTFAGSFLWALFLGFIGYSFGENWDALNPYIEHVGYLALIIVVIYVIWHLRQHFHKIKLRKK